MKIWICGVCQANWETVKQKEIWAVQNLDKTRNINDNDIILFYVKGTGLIRGIFQVSGEWYKTNRIEWADETNGAVRYPFQIRLISLLVGDASFIDIASRLSFVTMRCLPTAHITVSISGALNFGLPIPQHDYQLIKKVMQTNYLDRFQELRNSNSKIICI